MNDSKISVRYAKALFQSALEEKKLDKMISDVRLLEKSLEVEGFKEMLESMVIKTSDKKKFVQNVFENEMDELSFKFLILIINNKRENYLEAILRNVKAFYKENQGIRSAEITMASEMSNEHRKRFLKFLTETFKVKIELEEIIRPEIIGGFILKLEDEQYDASITSGLAKVKKNLLQKTLEK